MFDRLKKKPELKVTEKPRATKKPQKNLKRTMKTAETTEDTSPQIHADLKAAENEFILVGWTNSLGEGSYDYYVAKISVEQGNDWSAYQFIASTLIITIIALALLLFFIRRRINRKKAELKVNATLKQNIYSASP